MADFRQAIAQQLAPLAGVTEEQISTSIEEPKNVDVGDLNLPINKLNKFKRLDGNPATIASEWAAKVKPNNIIISATAVGPTINFFFKGGRREVKNAPKPLEFGASFKADIEAGRLPEVKGWVEKGENVNAVFATKDTPLHVAIDNGCLSIVTYLVNEKKVDVNAVDRNGFTPAHRLLYCDCHMDTVEKMAAVLAERPELNLNIQLTTAGSDVGGCWAGMDTPFLCGMTWPRKGHDDAIYNATLKFMEKKVKVDWTLKNKQGCTAYELAVRKGKNNLAELFESYREQVPFSGGESIKAVAADAGEKTGTTGSDNTKMELLQRCILKLAGELEKKTDFVPSGDLRMLLNEVSKM